MACSALAGGGGGGDPLGDRSTGIRGGKERTMVTCPRCGNPAILMASEEFNLLDCEFCDDVIDVSDLKLLPELEAQSA
jgi:hypothetical protein